MGINFRSRYAAAALMAGVLALSGCATYPDVVGTATVPVSAADPARGPSPLDSIPEEPYGYSLDEFRSILTGQEATVEVAGGPLTYATPVRLDGSYDGADLSNALLVAFQLDWVGAQRDTIYNGWRVENIRGNIDDINHFIAPSYRQNFLPEAQKQLKAAEEREANGVATTDAYGDYIIHVGKMAQGESATSAENKALWPDHQDAVVWMTFSGVGQPDQVIPVPRDTKATWSAPVITAIESAGDEIVAYGARISYTNTATVVLADGRSAQMTLERTTEVGIENGVWRVKSHSGVIAQNTLLP